jgi:uncharacterized membrane protein YbhN (UPF0104 family)
MAVVVGLTLAVRRSLHELQTQKFSLSSVHLPYFLMACLWYSLGMIPCWAYWHRILWVMGQRPYAAESLRAFFVGQLGKYVPGKATVVALRADWVRSERTRLTPAATSVFIETLTMMAVGAWLSCAYLILVPQRQIEGVPLTPAAMTFLAIVLMLAAGVPIWPPLFRKLVLLVGAKRADPEIETALEGIRLRLLFSGWCFNLVAWSCWGMSLLMILKSLPGVTLDWSAWPHLTACVALAMVAGFLSLIPGGLGVREMVILSLLGYLGGTVALVAAVLLRFAWLLSEVLLATILYIVRWGSRSSKVLR